MLSFGGLLDIFARWLSANLLGATATRAFIIPHKSPDIFVGRIDWNRIVCGNAFASGRA